MKNKRVFLLCGPSGCGKSSWIRERINKYGGYHVSRDMVRFNLLEEGEELKGVYSYCNKHGLWAATL